MKMTKFHQAREIANYRQKLLVSVKQDFFYCLELIKVYSQPLIRPLLYPKVSAEKIHY